MLETVNRDGNKTPRAIDLFAGAGGLSLGALQVGVKVLGAVENNRHAIATYRHNLIDSGLTSTLLFESDILGLEPRKVLDDLGIEPGDCDILLGGPPCQGFSWHRHKDDGVDDPRNRLLLRYFEYMRALRPSYFIVENVPGLLWSKHSSFLNAFYQSAAAEGYELFPATVLNAVDYGVPQVRRRVFIVGRLRGLSTDIPWPPPPTHFAPNARPGCGKPWNVAATVFESAALPGDLNDKHMCHCPELTAVFAATPQNGGSRKDSGRVLACHKTHTGHSDVYGRINPFRPGPTMTTACVNPSKGRFVHPTENHGITARQAARFQTFPEWYVFQGGLMAAATQIGNAVPVELARVIVDTIVKMWKQSRACPHD